MIYLVVAYPTEFAFAAVTALVLGKWNKGVISWHLMAILTMLGFVYVTDTHIPASQPITSSLPSKDMFVVNTGANSGFGFQTAKSLIEQQGSNIKVIMACRSMKKCQDAANQVDITVKTTNKQYLFITLGSQRSW